jgi:uncharacterized protein (DUF2147 family)
MRAWIPLVVMLMCVVGGAAADEEGDRVLGLWATDPEGDGGQAHVEIYKEGGLYHGKIVWLAIPVYPPDDDQGMAGRSKIDRNNPDPAMRERPVLGLVIVEGFHYAGDGLWQKGTIYDPDNGKTYKCKMRLTENGVLKVRGFIGFSLIGRTTEWTRPSTESSEGGS